MIENDSKLIELCNILSVTDNVKLRYYVNNLKYNSARYLISRVKDEFGEENSLKNKAYIKQLDMIENYLINKVEEQHDRERI